MTGNNNSFRRGPNLASGEGGGRTAFVIVAGSGSGGGSGGVSGEEGAAPIVESLAPLWSVPVAAPAASLWNTAHREPVPPGEPVEALGSRVAGTKTFIPLEQPGASSPGLQDSNSSGNSGSTSGQHAADDSEIPAEGEGSNGKDPDDPMNLGDPGGGTTPHEEQLALESGKGQVQTSKIEDGNSEGAQG
ncbi:uncharacterized protein LOC131876509 [Cryptomeria japonica]|uniref:uncharacterized protein LOC131876509 n=1 Tax=Cryptomeria japonica TaxID=3369 RepID=UPI0027DA9088|nr:uncharacterized protein LOC131876509 [Cryptomeria japonica]